MAPQATGAFKHPACKKNEGQVVLASDFCWRCCWTSENVSNVEGLRWHRRTYCGNQLGKHDIVWF